MNKNMKDVFAIAPSMMQILDSKYDKAGLDACLKLINNLDSKQKLS
jgi:hypothetical protein